MNLEKYNLTEDQLNVLRHRIGYQPYIFSENEQAGIADVWINKSGVKHMKKSEVPAGDWIRFTSAQTRMRRMYDDWMDMLCDSLGTFEKMTVRDMACNAGYFLYHFLQKGFSEAIGYDRDAKYGDVFNVLNRVTGFNAAFKNVAYDQFTHTIPNCRQADLVISCAIMCHLSDPTYYLNFLGSITKRCLFLFSTINESNTMTITYKNPIHYYCDPYPICFDNMTTISTSLLKFGLEAGGFKTIHEIPYSTDWMPQSWYRVYKAYICLKA